jgi:hypothetical protein
MDKPTLGSLLLVALLCIILIFFEEAVALVSNYPRVSDASVYAGYLILLIISYTFKHDNEKEALKIEQIFTDDIKSKKLKPFLYIGLSIAPICLYFFSFKTQALIHFAGTLSFFVGILLFYLFIMIVALSKGFAIAYHKRKELAPQISDEVVEIATKERELVPFIENFMSWILGLVFVYFALVGLTSEPPEYVFFCYGTTMAILLLPPLRHYAYKRSNMKLSVGQRIIVYISVLLIASTVYSFKHMNSDQNETIVMHNPQT